MWVKTDQQLTAVLHNKHKTCVQLTNTAVYPSGTAQLCLSLTKYNYLKTRDEAQV
jgi:hypothetical protein